jgi:hypothetical protein
LFVELGDLKNGEAYMKKEFAIVLVGCLLMVGISAASATGMSQPAKALSTAQVQKIDREKILGAPNGMLAEMLEGLKIG